MIIPVLGGSLNFFNNPQFQFNKILKIKEPPILVFGIFFEIKEPASFNYLKF
jgi:hypothetical protein